MTESHSSTASSGTGDGWERRPKEKGTDDLVLNANQGFFEQALKKNENCLRMGFGYWRAGTK